MPLVQVYITAQARTIYNINLPTGLYQFRLLDFLYLDTTSASNSANRILVTASSDTWRIPYGNASKSNTLLLVNRSDNGRVNSMATFNFLAEVRNGQMDITLTGKFIEKSIGKIIRNNLAILKKNLKVRKNKHSLSNLITIFFSKINL